MQRDNQDKLSATVSALQLHHPAYHGQLDSQLTITGAFDAPAVAGDVRISRGALVISQAAIASLTPAKPSTTNHPATGEPLGASNSRSKGSKGKQGKGTGPYFGAMQLPQRSKPGESKGFSLQVGKASTAAAEDAAAPPAPPAPPSFMPPLQLSPLSIHIGPDLRVSSFPFVQLNLAGAHVNPAHLRSIQRFCCLQSGPLDLNLTGPSFC